MSQTLTLGPLAFSVVALLGIVAALLGTVAGAWAGRSRRVALEPVIWWAAVAGLVAARFAFVARFHQAYLDAPLSALDLRDGGWAPLAGVVAATAVLLVAAVRHRAMRGPLAVAVGTAGLIWAMGAAALATMPEHDGELPALTLQGLDGQDVALASFRGKPTIVNLWATWCPPCRRELPVMQRAQAEHPEVNFVFLNQGESGTRVRSFLAAQGLPLRNVLLDLHGQAGAQLTSRALPTTLFFDARGQLVATRVGELSAASLSQRLAAASTSSP
jgi:thiol-disulfide isomerase/thioredoxin